MIATLVLAAVLSSPAPPPLADAALVLSGDVAFERVDAAVALYLGGRVPVLVLTGHGVGGDDAHTLAERASRAGVPPEAVLMEDRSRSTRENIDFAAPLLQARGLRRVALVTSESHMERALSLARSCWPEFEWIAWSAPDAGAERSQSFAWVERLKSVVERLRGWF